MTKNALGAAMFIYLVMAIPLNAVKCRHANHKLIIKVPNGSSFAVPSSELPSVPCAKYRGFFVEKLARPTA